MTQLFNQRELPPGWEYLTLGAIGIWQGGGTPPKSNKHLWRDGSIPWVSPKDMKRLVIEDAEDKLNIAARRNPAFKSIPAGSMLVVIRSSILSHTLPVAVAAREVAFNQDIKALVPYNGIDARYIALYLRSKEEEVLEFAVKSGTTVESIDMSRFLDFPVSLAPSEEQRRIVAKLEPFLTRCAFIRTELGRVSRLVMRQRHDIFTSAFRGQLRKQGFPPGSSPPDWISIPLKTLISEGPSNGLSPRSASEQTGTLSLRLTATTSGVMRLDDHAVKRVQVKLSPDSRYWLRPGDLLVQRANAREHVGAAAIFDGPENTYIYPDLMMRIRIDDVAIRTYVWRYLNSPSARQYFQDNASGSAGNMPKITGEILRQLVIPLPPLPQVLAILDDIEFDLKKLNAIDVHVADALRLTDRLEKSFLSKAFTGKLVAQDSNELPASSFLTSKSVDLIDFSTEEVADQEGSHVSVEDNARDYMERQLLSWPAEGVSFEELRNEIPGTYVEIKEQIYKLLHEQRLSQRFDARERRMKLVRPQ